MSNQIDIVPVSPPLDGLKALARDARSEGFVFIDRLIEEWATGANRFDKDGETILGVYASQNLVAIGGLNIDPFAADQNYGRLRHVYVSPVFRRAKIGRSLVRALVRHAAHTFDGVRLRTDTADAAQFYVRLGFQPLTHQFATHQMAGLAR